MLLVSGTWLVEEKDEQEAKKIREVGKKEQEERVRGWRECIRIRNKVAYLHGEIAVYIRTADCKLHRKS